MDMAIQHLYVQPVRLNAREIDTDTSTLFQEALRDPSNLESDWLWLGAQLTHAGEQSYCLEQALRINPDSQLAQRALARLAQRPSAPLDLKEWSRHAWQQR